MFNGKIHYKWPCSIAFCMFTRGSYSVSFNNSDHGQRARSEQGDLQLLPSPAVELGLHGESLDRLMDGFLDEWIYGVYIITYYMQYIYMCIYMRRLLGHWKYLSVRIKCPCLGRFYAWR